MTGMSIVAHILVLRNIYRSTKLFVLQRTSLSALLIRHSLQWRMRASINYGEKYDDPTIPMVEDKRTLRPGYLYTKTILVICDLSSP